MARWFMQPSFLAVCIEIDDFHVLDRLKPRRLISIDYGLICLTLNAIYRTEYASIYNFVNNNNKIIEDF